MTAFRLWLKALLLLAVLSIASIIIDIALTRLHFIFPIAFSISPIIVGMFLLVEKKKVIDAEKWSSKIVISIAPALFIAFGISNLFANL